jgi:glutathione synthase/RimK-type ligase-like ATP-grasp enzyme
VTAPVLLATCAALPGGEPGGSLLTAALGARDIESRWVVWDDPGVDWSGGLVSLRSTWDYDGRVGEFLAWTRSLPWVLNGADVFAWNTDKAYLVELGELGVPVVPTISVDAPEHLGPAMAAHERPLVKPRVGAGGRGVVVGAADSYGSGPWVVQPLVESIRDFGELSVYVLDGEPVTQARKLPAPGEVRVHEEYGGRTVADRLADESADLAIRACRAAEQLLGHRLDYARVDAMSFEGRLVVSELEVTEPGLYLDVLPGNAELFASLLARRVEGEPSRRNT